MSFSELLAQVPLFSLLEPNDLEWLSTRLQHRLLETGELLFRRGEVDTDLSIIQEGELALRLGAADGRQVTLAWLGRGDTLGELTLLDGTPPATDAVARAHTTLVCLRREPFLRFLQERPRVMPRLLAGLSQRVRQVIRTVHDPRLQGARARLVGLLKDLAHGGNTLELPGDTLRRLIPDGLSPLEGLPREDTEGWLHFCAREGLLSDAD